MDAGGPVKLEKKRKWILSHGLQKGAQSRGHLEFSLVKFKSNI